MIPQIPSCKNFNGYKPCFPDHNCWTQGCKEHHPIGTKILIINLDAMGDVLMTTAQLAALKRAYPVSTIVWVTLPIAAPLLLNNPYLDQVMPYNFENISILNALEFDIVLSCDKSQRSAALATQVHARDKRGFGLDINGKIYPYNDGAHYNFLLGMDNELKFKRNTQTGQEYLAATFEIPYERNEYVFNFTKEEKKFIAEYRQSLGLRNDQKTVGFNTGCSTLFPNKKMTVAQHCDIIARLLNETQYNILLFGGPEDAERNLEIFEHFGGAVINTPVNTGVRRGACYMDAADVVITGDSFGMHLAIALKKFVIAWFGLSCWTEIDLYNRGVKLYPSALDCSPCWKKHCPFDLECVKMIDLDRVFSETVSYLTSIPE